MLVHVIFDFDLLGLFVNVGEVFNKLIDSLKLKRRWCSGNINAFQAFALGSIPGRRIFLVTL